MREDMCKYITFYVAVHSDEEASGGEESGSGCDSPSCDTDRDIYFSTPPNRVDPRVNLVHSETSAGVTLQGSVALALCGLALLTAYLR